MEPIKAYKIVESDNRGNLKMLFHGINKSKIIAPDVWIKADEKMVKDGTSKTEYLSGWHVLLTHQGCVDYLSAFKNRLDQLHIVEVLVKEIRPKEHSPSPVFLAREMYLPSSQLVNLKIAA